MLAVGFLSLLSLGFIAMATDDDVTVLDEDENDQLPSNNFLQVDVGDPLGPLGVNTPADNIEDLPGTPIVPLPADGPVEDMSSFSGDAGDAEIIRPPMGAQYYDPSSVPPEPISLEDGTEVPGEPEDSPSGQNAINSVNELVVVSNLEGAEFSDELVLEHDENQPLQHIVKAPDEEHSITVSYDGQNSFLIEYSNTTDSITAGLNSEITGPDGDIHVEDSEGVDQDGTAFSQKTITQTFDGSTDITLAISEEQIGAGFSDISLTNPADTLYFDFENEVEGSFHLVFKETTSGDASDARMFKKAYIIQTPVDVGVISEDEFSSIVSEEENGPVGYNLIADVYLGHAAAFVNGDLDSGAPYQVIIDLLVNHTPEITSNLEWTSQQNFS